MVLIHTRIKQPCIILTKNVIKHFYNDKKRQATPYFYRIVRMPPLSSPNDYYDRMVAFCVHVTWTITRFGVPAAVDGCIPEPVREFFLAATVTTLARVLEVGSWEEVVVLVVDGSWLDEYDDKLAQDCDFFSFRLLEPVLVMAVA